MKTSCIQHPTDEPLVVLHKWQSDAFNDSVAGTLLSYFEYWHGVKTGMNTQAAHMNRVSAQHGFDGYQDESSLQYHTQKEIEQHLLRIGRKTKIKTAIATLTDHGIISIQKNPNPKFKFDQTNYYEFHPEVVNAFLKARTIEKLEWSKTANADDTFDYSWAEYDQWVAENGQSLAKNDQTITEINSRDYSREDPPSPPTGECANQPDNPSDQEEQAKGKGKRKSSKKGPTGPAIYKAMKNLDVFEGWWTWYGDVIAPIPEQGKDGIKSAVGQKGLAGTAWLALEKSDFHGLGLTGFKDACKLFRLHMVEIGGIGIQHGHRYLSGGKSGIPKWLELHQEANANAAASEPNDFLSDDPVETPKQIGKELARLKLSGLLPEEWQSDGVTFVSDLDESTQREYLAHLKSLPDPEPLKFSRKATNPDYVTSQRIAS